MVGTLSGARYGKAEVRLVHVERTPERHDLTDLTVSVALAGDLSAAYRTGDNTNVLPTDTQKNTVYAFARDGIGPIESFGVRLARHFVERHVPITAATVRVESHPWERVGDHSFSRAAGEETRTAVVSWDTTGPTVRAGLAGLLLLNSTGSEFTGFAVDEYTTLEPATDRMLATAVTATWRYAGQDAPDPGLDYDQTFAQGRTALIEAFACTYSRSLQQTLYAMAERLLDRVPQAVEVSLALPNQHHHLANLAPFGLDNPGRVFAVTDRPYGLIEGTVRRE